MIGMITPPPLELVPILKTYCKVFVTGTDHTPPPPWNVDDVTQAMSKGGGVFQFFGGRMTSRGMSKGGGGLVNVQEWGCFSIFRRADDVTRTRSKGCVCVLVNVQEWGCFSIFRRADDVTRTMSKGGACGISSPPPPFRKFCIRACYLCKISGKSTPLPPPP